MKEKNNWCPICRTEHIKNTHTNKITKWTAENIFNECIRFVPALQTEKAHELMMLRINDCIKIHNYLDGDACGIGNSYKFWNEVKKEALQLK